MEHFKVLNKIDVSEKVDKKKDTRGKELTYLSWAWAWAEIKKIYPAAQYEIKKFENNLPYIYDPNTGYMVFTSVTIENFTHDMWLPVMNGNNKAMKNAPYEYTTQYGKKLVEAATMFDINKSIMRCLTKNLAMFGLGLYIFAGEDLPEVEEEQKTEQKTETKAAKTSKEKSKPIVNEYINNIVTKLDEEKKQEKINQVKIKEIEDLALKVNLDSTKVKDWITKKFNKKELKDLILNEANELLKALEGLKK
jgi:hypothetical protein